MLQQQLDPGLVKGPIDVIDLCRNDQLQPDPVSDLNGPIRSFFWTDAPDEGEIAIAVIAVVKVDLGNLQLKGVCDRTYCYE